MADTSYYHTLENILIMTVFSTISPIVGGIIKGLSDAILILLPEVYKSLRRKFGPSCYSFTIQSTNILHSKRGWMCVQEEVYNERLINAVLYKITSNMNYVDSVRCNLQVDPINLCLTPLTNFRYNNFTVNFTKAEPKSSDRSEKTITTLKISSQQNIDKIKQFVLDCYTEYKELLDVAQSSDTNRYYFTQATSKQNEVIHKRYRINNYTSFDSIYLPEKDKIIELLDKLGAKKLPRLGFLFHGEPGCGKSSLIKAIAKYTHRHIIAVKLSQIGNDEALFEIFNNHNISCYMNNQDTHGVTVHKILHDKRIYILEDIDAECDIIKKRLSNISVPEIAPEKENGADKDLQSAFFKYLRTKELTLSGILNVLDGVLELNGSIVIMTTNHVENIDDALIRPGRITLNLELKKMVRQEAIRMINKTFPGADSAIRDYVFTPAMLESLIFQSNNITELNQLIDDYQKAH